MHDIHFLRTHPDAFDAALARRGQPPHAQALLAIDSDHRAVIQEGERAKHRRNELSKLIGQMKAKGEDASALMAEVTHLKEALPALETKERELNARIHHDLAVLPNLPAADVPDGKDEHDNVELRRVGTPRDFDFKPLEHWEIGEKLGLMEFEIASKLSGSRFVVLKGALARLERALAAFMLDIHTGEFGFQEHALPYLVRKEALYGTGQLPKFEEDLFKTTSDHYLIPTSEVPLTNLLADQIIEEDATPLRYTALTPCFRSEAGAAGRDTRGMIRQHQFHKVELVSLTRADQSEAEHEYMTRAAETVLDRLELPYRTIVLCAGDMGFSARKTYDIEVWLPGQNSYREISSCSNCGEFQARRMMARHRVKGQKHPHYLHTLNGSGVAVGRCLIAVLENGQQADGSVILPDALKPYMHGIDVLRPA